MPCLCYHDAWSRGPYQKPSGSCRMSYDISLCLSTTHSVTAVMEWKSCLVTIKYTRAATHLTGVNTFLFLKGCCTSTGLNAVRIRAALRTKTPKLSNLNKNSLPEVSLLCYPLDRVDGVVIHNLPNRNSLEPPEALAIFLKATKPKHKHIISIELRFSHSGFSRSAKTKYPPHTSGIPGDYPGITLVND